MNLEERNHKLLAAVARGHSLRNIAVSFGLTLEYVRRIVRIARARGRLMAYDR